MDISSSQAAKDRISELPDNILHECLSLLEMKNAAQTSILGRRWRYMWTHWTNLDFDPNSMYPEEYATFFTHDANSHRYFAWINQVVSMHQGPCIDKFRVHFHYYSSCATQLGIWVKFALSKRAKELVLDLIGLNLEGPDYSEKGFPLGFDMLRHPPCYSGITVLQSLHLEYVDVSQEFIEFLLSRCHHLERLYLASAPLSRLTVRSSKLKYLTILMTTSNLEHLEIDAENLVYFQYGDTQHDGGPCMVFKSLPMLVEASFCGGFCRSPFPIFNKLVLFSKQLYKISLELRITSSYPVNLVIPEGIVIPIFPNVKHFTCTIICYGHSCILPMKRFIKACPMLEEFKLQVDFMTIAEELVEARELQEIDLENEDEIEEMNNSEIGLVREADVGNTNEEEQSHPSLRILEVVGFAGASCDVQLALAIVSYASSLKTIICDPAGVRYSCTGSMFWSDSSTQYKAAKRRARKLAKIVAPKVTVMIV
ncbi:hypothetical protein KSS87_000918 [Heliosperma pusillum]|nr:hypothetical protein KSS87_000918 [Heliosperma pusillum]